MVGILRTLLLVSFALVSAQVLSPPNMLTTTWPKDIIYVLDNSTITCRAEGNPKPKYVWKKDGENVREFVRGDTYKAVWFKPNSGELNLPSIDSVNGVYQCLAVNSQGTAMSPFVPVYKISIGFFIDGEPKSKYDLSTYQYLRLDCENQPESQPPGVVTWSRSKTTSITTTVDVIPGPNIHGNRILVDPKGSLHFLWLESSDQAWSYVCQVYNKHASVRVGSHEPYNLVINAGSTQVRAPTAVYNADVFVKKGNDAKLVCIFNYYPGPGDDRKGKFTVSWQKDGENPIGLPGFVLDAEDESGGTIIVKNAQLRDAQATAKIRHEGVYTCSGNLLGSTVNTQTLNLTVTSEPVFIERLTSKKVPVGEDAHLSCETKSYNAIGELPVWYVNSVPILGCPPYSGFFECKTRTAQGHSQCIKEKNICNNIGDCNDNSDEIDCSTSCTEGQVLCNRKCQPPTDPCEEFPPCSIRTFDCPKEDKCLPAQQLCDNTTQCSDNSDEQNCPFSPSITVSDHPRFIFFGDRTKLVIKNVVKADNMCLQCSVKNAYGLAFADGCMTVIDSMIITYQPNATYTVKPGDKLNLGIAVTNDPSVLSSGIKYKWFMEERGENSDQRIPLPPSDMMRYFRVTQVGKNLTIIVPNGSGSDSNWAANYQNVLGKYSVQVNNTHEVKTLYFELQGEVLPPVTEPTIQKASVNLWFIALIIGILLLFIVVALIICYMHRNRGGTYPLDKKEHQAGHNPEQELKDSGFHDVGRVGDDFDDKPRPDEVSLSESVKPYESDEDLTEEYGADFDISKFNEDGSFIGLYGDKKSKTPKDSQV